VGAFLIILGGPSPKKLEIHEANTIESARTINLLRKLFISVNYPS